MSCGGARKTSINMVQLSVQCWTLVGGSIPIINDCVENTRATCDDRVCLIWSHTFTPPPAQPMPGYSIPAFSTPNQPVPMEMSPQPQNTMPLQAPPPQNTPSSTTKIPANVHSAVPPKAIQNPIDPTAASAVPASSVNLNNANLVVGVTHCCFLIALDIKRCTFFIIFQIWCICSV